MGQKINPHGFRVGVIKEWDSVWYADKDNYSDYLYEDYLLREYIKENQNQAGISRIVIQRTAERIRITIHAAKPGIIIGRGGTNIQALSAELQKMTNQKLMINIEEVKRPELDAQLVAEDIARQLESRVAFRRAMKQSINRSMKMGALGVKIQVSGILGGADMARTESYHEGSIPLQTLRADIDYGFAEANTTFGINGVKVWIYKGEILPEKASAEEGSEK